MVRRDEDMKGSRHRPQGVSSRCASPTGASPVRVIAGEPGSRSTSSGDGEARHQEPLRREQERGPQHQVKPAASTDAQWKGRAAHVTAKAILDEQKSGAESPSSLSGVWGAARVQGEARNTRDPAASSSSRQCAPYKPKAKSGVAQRKSEGVVVPLISTTKNVEGGKGLCFGHARRGATCEGMPARANHPVVLVHDDKARHPQRELWVRAKSGEASTTTRARPRRDGRGSLGPSRPRTVMQATPRRPSGSRVREIRKHGLNGGPESLLMTRVPRKGLRIYQ